MREIAFDTETTGLFWDDGDRVIEVGCVELLNHIPTGRTFRRLINPGRLVSDKTVEITGITDEMLENEPPFEAIAEELLEFIGDSTVVAHNAKFDRGFLNMELELCGREIIPEPRWVDTVALAKEKFPGAQASLDALCKRFNVSLDSRVFHGALLDAQLLADVYLELRGGRARAFAFDDPDNDPSRRRGTARQRPVPWERPRDPDEVAAHQAFIARLGGEEGSIWSKIFPPAKD